MLKDILKQINTNEEFYFTLLSDMEGNSFIVSEFWRFREHVEAQGGKGDFDWAMKYFNYHEHENIGDWEIVNVYGAFVIAEFVPEAAVYYITR